jgi:hypothetical protein
MRCHAGSSFKRPLVNPAFGTPLVSAPSAAAAGGLEVRQEVLVWLHGDDAPALRPDLREQRDEQPPPLGGLGLQFPERGEVTEQLLSAGLSGERRRVVAGAHCVDRRRGIWSHGVGDPREPN